MDKKSKDLLYHYCNDCKLDINPNDKASLAEHVEHNIIAVYDGDKDPSLVEEFKKNGLCLERQNPKEKEPEKDERSPSKKALDLAKNKILKIVINENNSDEVYAITNVNSHVETIDLSSPRARYWLNDLYHKNINSNEIHSDDFFKTVLNNIISHAQMNGTQRTKIHVRIAQLDDEIWYDLGTTDWSAIKISKDGISTVKLGVDSPIFFRSQSLQSQVIPKEKDEHALEDIVDLLKISKSDRLVFLVNLIALFLESIPVPMLVLDGSAGSMKTTVTAAVKSIVDPSGKRTDDNVSAMSEKHDDLIGQLYNRYLTGFDNVSNIDPKTSDIICRAITGSSNPKRKLYTNQEESIRSFRRKIVLNGVVPTLEYPDLQTRLLNYSRDPVNETDRLTEKEFNIQFSSLLPSVLGQIFIIICKSIREYDNVKSKIRPKTRMADFEVWGETISRVLGNKENEFLNRYYEKLNEESIYSQDAYPLIGTINHFMSNKSSVETTASSLYKDLVTAAIELGIDIKARFVRFPRSSNKLSRDLRIIDPLLKVNGFVAHTYHYTGNDGRFTKNASIIRIDRKEKQSSLGNYQNVSSPSSPPSPSVNLGTKIGEDTGEDTIASSEAHSPKNDKITHKTMTCEHGEDSEDTFQTSPTSMSYFMCWTCNEKGTDPMPISKISSNGLTLESHQKMGHSIQMLTAEEAKLVRDYHLNGGLKPDVFSNKEF